MEESQHSSAPIPADDKPKRGRQLRWLRTVLALLVLGFVAYAFKDLLGQWQSSALRVSKLKVALSLVPLTLGTLGLALSWKWLIERMTGKRVATAPTMALHLESQLARYVPGKVGVPVIRMAGASSIGVAASAVGASVMVETLSLMSVGATFSFCVLALCGQNAEGVLALLGRWAVPMTALFGLSTLILVSVDRRRYPQAVLRVLRAEGTGPLLPAILPLVHLSYWVLWAAHGYLVSRAVGAEHATALASTGLYSLAPVVGFIVLVAPAGIGVREALLSFGLAPAVGPAGAITAALISRCASLIGDVATWLCFKPFAAKRTQSPAD